MKRIFDIAVSSVALVLVLPLLVIAAIWITLDSRGPVFYRGTRAGLRGKPFRIWKLRTMVTDAEQQGGAETPADDPRITRAGNFLRRYKVDELPQLLNVLSGEMSLVGPRPEVMDEVAGYDDQQRRLLDVKPGITDWASILFRNEDELLRGSSDPHADYHRYIRPEKIRLGLQYVDRHSLLTDLTILVRTALALADTRVAERRALEWPTSYRSTRTLNPEKMRRMRLP